MINFILYLFFNRGTVQFGLWVYYYWQEEIVMYKLLLQFAEEIYNDCLDSHDIDGDKQDNVACSTEIREVLV